MRVLANGLGLNIENHGTGDVALVFLHYWGGTARSWAAVMAAVPAGLRSVAIDARGWGQSDRPDAGYDIATMADDVAAVISELGLNRFVLVGHSMGSKVAQLLASRRPTGLIGLVLVAPSPAQGKTLAPEERAAMGGAYASAEAIGWTIDNVLAGWPLSAEQRAQVIADSLGGAEAAKAAWPASAISEDVSAELGRIDVPVLIIGGEADKVDSVAMLRETVLPALPGAEMVVVPSAGHLLPLETPDALAAHIAAFAGRVRARPEDLPVAFDAALNRGDLDAVEALFHPRATMRLTDGTLVRAADDGLRVALKKLIGMQAVLRNSVRQAIVSDDVALLLLDWDITLRTPDGGRIVQNGTATQVAERVGEGWVLRISNPLGIRSA